MAGPATNAASITVIGQNLGKKTLAIYLTSLIVGSLLFGLLIDYFLPGNWFLPLFDHLGSHEHSLLPKWLNYFSVAFLSFMLIFNYFNQIIKNQIMKKANKISELSLEIPALKVGVEGMTCQHCKKKVEDGLMEIPGVTNVSANTETDTVDIYGNNIESNTVQKIINDLGYIFKGKL